MQLGQFGAGGDALEMDVGLDGVLRGTRVGLGSARGAGGRSVGAEAPVRKGRHADPSVRRRDVGRFGKPFIVCGGGLVNGVLAGRVPAKIFRNGGNGGVYWTFLRRLRWRGPCRRPGRPRVSACTPQRPVAGPTRFREGGLAVAGRTPPAAGVPGRVPHDPRSTRTKLSRASSEIEQIQCLLGQQVSRRPRGILVRAKILSTPRTTA